MREAPHAVATVVVHIETWQPLHGRLGADQAGADELAEFHGWSGLAAALTALAQRSADTDMS